MSKSVKGLLLIAAVLLLGLASGLFYSVKPYYPSSWATVPSISHSQSLLTDEQKIICNLGEDCRVQDARVSRQDSELLSVNPVPIANFHTVAGNDVHLSVLFVRFEDKKIEPEAAWNTMIRSLKPRTDYSFGALVRLLTLRRTNDPPRPAVLVVNSVDQEESISDQYNQSLAYWLNRSCGPWDSYAGPLSLGTISVHRCSGDEYKNVNHVGWVSNQAAVIWSDARHFRTPCWEIQDARRKAGDSPAPDLETKYQECLQQAAGDTVKQLFSHLREHPEIRPEGLVLNAVGTGQTGHLSKARWYPEVTSQLLQSIQDPKHAANLPSNILFAVYLPQDESKTVNTIPGSWPDERMAIASAVGVMVRDWTLTNHEVPKAIEATTLLIPALVAVGILSLLVVAGFPRISPGISLGVALTKTFLETVGVMSILVALLQGLGEKRPLWFDLILASIGLLVASCYFLHENLKRGS